MKRIQLILSASAAACVIAVLAYMLGYWRGSKDEYCKRQMRYQLYGDIHRDSWREILTNDLARAKAITFYSNAVDGVADIRTIVLGLDDYIGGSSDSPNIIIESYRDWRQHETK